jgi:hypothetical protein
MQRTLLIAAAGLTGCANPGANKPISPVPPAPLRPDQGPVSNMPGGPGGPMSTPSNFSSSRNGTNGLNPPSFANPNPTQPPAFPVGNSGPFSSSGFGAGRSNMAQAPIETPLGAERQSSALPGAPTNDLPRVSTPTYNTTMPGSLPQVPTSQSLTVPPPVPTYGQMPQSAPQYGNMPTTPPAMPPGMPSASVPMSLPPAPPMMSTPSGAPTATYPQQLRGF